MEAGDDADVPRAGAPASRVSFRLQGELPTDLRFRIGAAGEDPVSSQYCTYLDPSAQGRRDVALTDLVYECWNGYGAAFPEEAEVTLISWQLAANPACSQAFDFCISELEVLP